MAAPGPGRPVLLLVAGSRGTVLADTCAALEAVADVVVATAEDLFAQRADRSAGLPPVRGVVRAAHREDLLDAVRAHAGAHRVDGVLTFSDDVVELTAAIAAALGLPGQPVATVGRFRDKALQRAALAAAGLPVPAHAEITTPAGADAALAAVRLPAILKPTRGSGGTLAFVVTAPEQLAPLLARGFRDADRVGAAVDGHTAFLLEELIVGTRWHAVDGFAPYVSVESAVVDGRPAHLAVTDRFPVAPPVLETGMVLPSSLAPDQQDAVREATTAALRALDLRHGLAHTELMLTATGPVVIEVNARAGGALPYLFPLAGGPDLTALAGRVALGDLPDHPPTFHGHAVFTAPQHPLGVRVAEVTGLDAARDVPGVRVVIPLAGAGASTESQQHTMAAVVLGTAASPAEAVAQHHAVRAAVRARYLPVALPEHYRRTPDGTVAPQPVSDPIHPTRAGAP
jgi:biotin carboxylase